MRFCPHCGGDLSKYMAVETCPSTTSGQERTPSVAAKYDQTATWKRLIARANEVKSTPPRVDALVLGTMEHFVGEPLASTIVHVVFDRNIVPSGGVLYRAMMLDGRTKTSPEHLSAMGYAVEDRIVKTVNDVPVGPIYGVLEYWGGERQHKRWHLAEPVTIEPSRNGDPLFMDENMLAFGTRWRNFDRMQSSLIDLLTLFAEGLKGGQPIGQPLALELLVETT